VPAALRNATRQLGILLAIRGNQNDDVQVMRRALGLLDSISSDLDSDARQVRDMLRGAIQQAEAPSGGPSPQRPSSTPSQETTQGAKKGCFIATAVYGSPLAAEVILCASSVTGFSSDHLSEGVSSGSTIGRLRHSRSTSEVMTDFEKS